MFGVALTYTADENYIGAFAPSHVVNAKNTRLFSLLAVNKGSDAWLEIYDHASAATGTPIELPLLASSFMSVVFPNGKKYGNGVFVRLVSSQGGSVVAGNDLKVSAEFMTGPVS